MRVEHRSAKGSGSDDWQTPEDLLTQIRRFAPIALDPCTADSNPTGADRYYTIEDDGLDRSWETPGLVYCNPPYSQAATWLMVADDIAQGGQEILALVAARPCTRYWFRHVWDRADAVIFLEGRLTFRGAPNPAPFESALIYWGEQVERLRHVFEQSGHGRSGKVVTA